MRARFHLDDTRSAPRGGAEAAASIAPWAIKAADMPFQRLRIACFIKVYFHEWRHPQKSNFLKAFRNQSLLQKMAMSELAIPM